MTYVKDSKSAKVRRQLSHPVIDGDGHWLEPMPIFLDYLEQVGGRSLVERFRKNDVERGRYAMHTLHPLFSSDVSHFDVTDMTEVLEEAWELVEHGMITEQDFSAFTFENAARLHTALNEDFFKGTVVEGAVGRLLRG